MLEILFALCKLHGVYGIATIILARVAVYSQLNLQHIECLGMEKKRVLLLSLII